ncbi:MAG: hypothetical protein ACI9UN_000943 [Granulosicoccus sp.]|jgi:hypothetical protein
MKESDPTLEQFEAILCQRGLDPVEQDIEKMHAAWCLLRQHLEKMKTVVHSAQTSSGESCITFPQAIFTPTFLGSREDR